MTQPPKPGVYPGVPFADYLRWNAINASVLHLFERSAAHAHEELFHPKDSTKAQALGQAAHFAVLEPELFDGLYVRAPEIGRRLKAEREAWERFEALHREKTVLPCKDYDLCIAVRDAVWSHPTASALLKGKGLNEVAIAWVDAETKALCKARFDRLTTFDGYSVIVDLKTAVNASERGFQAAVARYFYHESAAFYLDGADTLSPRPRRFFHLVVEKERPWCVAVYELGQAELDEGRALYRKHLRQYIHCVETNAWPGYPSGVVDLALPAWAYRSVDFEEAKSE